MKLYGSIYTGHGMVKGSIEWDNKTVTDIRAEKGSDELIILPGIIDTHCHATQGYNPWAGRTRDELTRNMEGFLKGAASEGVTSVFPTMFGFNEPDQPPLALIEAAVPFAEKTGDYRGARVAGLHYEGPYLNRVGEKGVRTPPPPIDLKYMEQVIDTARGHLRLMGLAPELPGSAELTELLLSRGVAVAFTHTDCQSAEAFAAFDRGVSVATHLCNVMTGIHHRDIGGLGAAILDDRVYTELICDGLHVCNDMLRLILRAKPNDKIMMISDCTGYSGAPVGTYGGFSGPDSIIIVDEEGFVRDPNGRLRGSSQCVLYGVRNLVKSCGVSLETAVRLSSGNAARKYGLTGRGELKKGGFADLIVLNKDLELLATYVEGEKVFDISERDSIFNRAALADRRDA